MTTGETGFDDVSFDLISVHRGEPLVVVRDGQPLPRVMGRQRLSMADLSAAAREQGVEAIPDIRVAVLEVDGRLSIFTTGPEQSGAREQPAAG